MGQLLHPRSSLRRFLKTDHLIGRREGCDLQLDDAVASNVHALIRFRGGAWTVRDLGSRNGVYVDGARIGGVTVLRLGSTIGFGSPEEGWILADDSPPAAFAVSLTAPGLEVQGSAGTLGLPDPAADQVSISRTHRGWIAETGREVIDVHDGDEVDASGRWRLHLPDEAPDSTEAAAAVVHLAEATVQFRVSRDQEHIEIDVMHRGGTHTIEHYAANELLLVLALARLEDAGAEDREARGWIQFEDLARRVSLDPEQPRDESRVRQWIHSSRRRFEAVGVREGSRIVERRSGSRQVRLGVDDVRIGPLTPDDAA